MAGAISKDKETEIERDVSDRKKKKTLSKKKIEPVLPRTYAKLREYQTNRLLKKCSNCSMCRDECPTYYASGQESYYAGGRLRVLRTFVERDIPLSEDFIQAMYFCTTCKQCEDICPISMEYVDMIEDLRKEIVTKTHKPYGNLINLAKNVNQFKNPYGEETAKRGECLIECANEAEKSDYAYFVGCTASFRTKSAAQNTAKILSKIVKQGIVVLGSGEYCCGSPLIRTGQVDFQMQTDNGPVHFSVKDLITHNIDSLVMRDVKDVVYSCSGCYKTSTQDWPKIYGKPLPFKTHHITQFLQEMIETGKVKLKSFPKKVAYHDPCHLGRHSKVYEAPRLVLHAIPDLQYIELRKNRNRARCCGAGGGVKSGYPKYALEIAKIRVQEAIDSGAEILATSCVFCKYNFLDAVKAMNAKIEIMNIEDIIVNLIE